MSEQMLRFVSIEPAGPAKRPADARATDFEEIYADYAAQKAASRRRAVRNAAYRSARCIARFQTTFGLAEADRGRPDRRGLRTLAIHQQHAGNLRPHLPAGPAVRGQLRHRAVRPRHCHHRRHRKIPDRHRMGARLGASAEGATRTPATRRRDRRGPRGFGRGRTAPAQGLQGHGIRPPRSRRRFADLRHPQFQAGERNRPAARETACRRWHQVSAEFRSRPRCDT